MKLIFPKATANEEIMPFLILKINCHCTFFNNSIKLKLWNQKPSDPFPEA
jgi:hypothetical protein